MLHLAKPPKIKHFGQAVSANMISSVLRRAGDADDSHAACGGKPTWRNDALPPYIVHDFSGRNVPTSAKLTSAMVFLIDNRCAAYHYLSIVSNGLINRI